MKFKLYTAKTFYEMSGEENKEKEKLEKLGFVFKIYKSDWRVSEEWHLVESSTIDINSLEELMVLIKEWGNVVVSEDDITIYNDYLE